MGLACVNVVAELAVGMIFFALWLFFNRLIKDPSIRVQVRHRCIFNTLMIIIFILYLCSVIVFDFLDAILTDRALHN